MQLGNHSSVDVPQSTEYAKEMRKWESQHTKFGAPGRPYEFREFPKMLYQADRVEGKFVIVDRKVVGDENEQRNLQSREFYVTQQDALAACEKKYHVEYGTLAAERNYEIEHGKLSPRAAAEVRAAEQAHGASHLPVVAETPLRPKQK